jgi:hypothetical protein
MRRLCTFLATMALSAPALAMQSGNPPMPKVGAPTGWPIVGYLVAGVLFAAAVGLSLLASNRTDPDSGEVS